MQEIEKYAILHLPIYSPYKRNLIGEIRKGVICLKENIYTQISPEERARLAEDYGNVGKRIREARVKEGYTQKEFAGLIGISNAQVNRIELGKDRPSRESMKKISAYTGIPFRNLIRAAGYNTTKADNVLYDKVGRRIDTESLLSSMYNADSDLLIAFQDFNKIGSKENVKVLLLLLKAMRKEVDETVPEHIESDNKLFVDSFKALKQFIISSYGSL